MQWEWDTGGGFLLLRETAEDDSCSKIDGDSCSGIQVAAVICLGG
jgi:hypothetical protein